MNFKINKLFLDDINLKSYFKKLNIVLFLLFIFFIIITSSTVTLAKQVNDLDSTNTYNKNDVDDINNIDICKNFNQIIKFDKVTNLNNIKLSSKQIPFKLNINHNGININNDLLTENICSLKLIQKYGDLFKTLSYQYTIPEEFLVATICYNYEKLNLINQNSQDKDIFTKLDNTIVCSLEKQNIIYDEKPSLLKQKCPDCLDIIYCVPTFDGGKDCDKTQTNYRSAEFTKGACKPKSSPAYFIDYINENLYYDFDQLFNLDNQYTFVAKQISNTQNELLLQGDITFNKTIISKEQRAYNPIIIFQKLYVTKQQLNSNTNLDNVEDNNLIKTYSSWIKYYNSALSYLKKSACLVPKKNNNFNFKLYFTPKFTVGKSSIFSDSSLNFDFTVLKTIKDINDKIKKTNNNQFALDQVIQQFNSKFKKENSGYYLTDKCGTDDEYEFLQLYDQLFQCSQSSDSSCYCPIDSKLLTNVDISSSLDSQTNHIYLFETTSSYKPSWWNSFQQLLHTKKLSFGLNTGKLKIENIPSRIELDQNEENKFYFIYTLGDFIDLNNLYLYKTDNSLYFAKLDSNNLDLININKANVPFKTTPICKTHQDYKRLCLKYPITKDNKDLKLESKFTVLFNDKIPPLPITNFNKANINNKYLLFEFDITTTDRDIDSLNIFYYINKNNNTFYNDNLNNNKINSNNIFYNNVKFKFKPLPLDNADSLLNQDINKILTSKIQTLSVSEDTVYYYNGHYYIFSSVLSNLISNYDLNSIDFTIQPVDKFGNVQTKLTYISYINFPKISSTINIKSKPKTSILYENYLSDDTCSFKDVSLTDDYIRINKIITKYFNDNSLKLKIDSNSDNFDSNTLYSKLIYPLSLTNKKYPSNLFIFFHSINPEEELKDSSYILNSFENNFQTSLNKISKPFILYNPISNISDNINKLWTNFNLDDALNNILTQDNINVNKINSVNLIFDKFSTCQDISLKNNSKSLFYSLGNYKTQINNVFLLDGCFDDKRLQLFLDSFKDSKTYAPKLIILTSKKPYFDNLLNSDFVKNANKTPCTFSNYFESCINVKTKYNVDIKLLYSRTLVSSNLKSILAKSLVNNCYNSKIDYDQEYDSTLLKLTKSYNEDKTIYDMYKPSLINKYDKCFNSQFEYNSNNLDAISNKDKCISNFLDNFKAKTENVPYLYDGYIADLNTLNILNTNNYIQDNNDNKKYLHNLNKHSLYYDLNRETALGLDSTGLLWNIFSQMNHPLFRFKLTLTQYRDLSILNPRATSISSDLIINLKSKLNSIDDNQDFKKLNNIFDSSVESLVKTLKPGDVLYFKTPIITSSNNLKYSNILKNIINNGHSKFIDNIGIYYKDGFILTVSSRKERSENYILTPEFDNWIKFNENSYLYNNIADLNKIGGVVTKKLTYSDILKLDSIYRYN